MNAAVPSIEVLQLSVFLQNGATLIDVREPHEFAEIRAEGARLIPLGDVTEHTEELPASERFFVICHLGGRSARAVAWMRQQGLDAVNVTGGTNAWVEAGLATESDAKPE